MSRTKPDAGDRRMLEFACDRCGAAPGEWCEVRRHWLFEQPSGRPTYLLHAARFWTATAAGLLPLPASEVE